MLAVLHRAGEEVAEELQRLLAESVRRGIVDGRVIFVDQDDGALLVVGMERGGEDAKSTIEIFWRFLFDANPAIKGLLLLLWEFLFAMPVFYHIAM